MKKRILSALMVLCLLLTLLPISTLAAEEGTEPRPGLACLRVPSQEYAVLSHQGPIEQLGPSLNWFIQHWLPASSYRGLDGFELERYAPGFDGRRADASMEYWLPIVPCPG